MKDYMNKLAIAFFSLMILYSCTDKQGKQAQSAQGKAERNQSAASQQTKDEPMQDTTTSVQAESEAPGVADSLVKEFSNGKDDSAKIERMIEKVKAYYYTSSVQPALSLARYTADLAHKINYARGEATARKWIGNICADQSKSLEAFGMYRESLAIFEKIGDKKGVANILSNMGAIYADQGDANNASECLYKALQIAEEMNDSLRIATVYNNLYYLLETIPKMREKSIAYARSCLLIAEKINENPLVAASTTGLSNYYTEEEHWNMDSALFYAKKALEANKGTMEETQGLNTYGRIYFQNKDYARAIQYHKEALRLAIRNGSKQYQALSGDYLGRALFYHGEFEAAIHELGKAERYARESRWIQSQRSIYQNQALLYDSLHRYENAYRYQRMLTDIKDTIYNIESNQKVQNVQFAYDISKKEAQINLLKKEKEYRDQKIRREKLVRNGFIAGCTILILFLGILVYQRNSISKGKKRSDELLLNILPEEVADELKERGQTTARYYEQVTVLFTDFVDFTKISEKLSPQALVQELHECFSGFDAIMEQNGLEKIKTVGDAYIAVCGVPVENSRHAENCIRAAMQILAFIEERRRQGGVFEIRIGIHTGPVVAGIVGVKKFAYDIWGDTVNTASRLESSGEAGKINIFGATYALVGDQYDCTYRGKIPAKGKGEIDMYFVRRSLGEGEFHQP